MTRGGPYGTAARLCATSAGLVCVAVAEASGPTLSGLAAPAETAIDDATNPAGLTRLRRPEWDGQLIAIVTEDTDDLSTSGGAGRSVSNNSTLAIPAVYYGRPWNDRLALGISLTVPAGVGSDPGDATIGRYLLEKWSLGYVSLAPAVGYRVDDRLSLGLAVNLNYAVYNYESAVYNGPGQPDGTMKLNGGSFNVGVRLGALYELTPTTRLGLVYQSSTSASFTDTPEFTGLSPQRQKVLETAGVLTQPVSLENRFPQVVIAGGYHEFANHAAATLDVGWVNFSQFGLTQASVGNTSLATTNGRYQDMWMESAGLRWPLNARWDAQFGALYLSSGVSDSNRTFALRLDRVWGIGAGATYRWTRDRTLSVDLSYFNLGPAPVSVGIQGVGSLNASYSTNYAIALKVAYRWQSPDAR